jgi:hypothetical protein
MDGGRKNGEWGNARTAASAGRDMEREAAFSKDDAADSQIYPPVVGTSPFCV